MNFRDRDGNPAPSWRFAESASEVWKRCSAGRPGDCSGLTHRKLRGASGIRWPCTTAAPGGTERSYAGGEFWSAPEYCESYGKDLVTGAPLEPTEYRALNPSGKAIVEAAEYPPAHERPDSRRPFTLITGGDHRRAANELTITERDPVSEQPIFTTAAVTVRRCVAGSGPAPTTTGAAPSDTTVPPTVGGAPAMVRGVVRAPRGDAR